MQANNNIIINLPADEPTESLLASNSSAIGETVAVQRPSDYSLMSDPLIVQGGIAIAVILAITFLVEALVKLVEASHKE